MRAAVGLRLGLVTPLLLVGTLLCTRESQAVTGAPTQCGKEITRRREIKDSS